MSEHERLEKRVEELESLVAFQDRSLSRLDEVLTQFAARVQQLEADMKNKADAEEPEVGEHFDPPPHY